MNRTALSLFVSCLILFCVPVLADSVELSYAGSTLWSLNYDIEIEGDYAYCLKEHGLQILDVSDPGSPVLLSELFLEGSRARKMEIVGMYAYIAHEKVGLKVVDVSDPSSPVIVGHAEIPYEIPGVGFLSDIKVRGNFAYVAECDVALRVYDISDPTNPQQISYTSAPRINIIEIGGDYLYCIDIAEGNVIDISDPYSPVLVSGFDTPVFTHSIRYQEGYLYCANANQGLIIFELSDPLNPTIVGTYDFENTEFNKNSYDAFPVDNLVYVANGQGIAVIDVTDKTDPQFIRYDTDFYDCRGLDINGTDLVALTYYADDVACGSISIPENPERFGTFQAHRKTYAVDSEGDLAVAAGTGISIIDIADPTNPIVEYTIEIPDRVNDVRIENGYIYAIADNDLLIFSETSPGVFEQISYCAINFDIQGFDVEGDYAVVVSNPAQATVMDISDPYHPFVTGLYYYAPNYPRDLAIYGTTAYIADDDNGVKIIDFSNPGIPVFVGDVPTTGYAQSISISGHYAYVIATGVEIFDLTDPLNPQNITTSKNYFSAKDIFVLNNLAYTTYEYGNIKVYDMTDPLNPIELGVYDTPGDPQDITISGDQVLVADYNAFLILNADYHLACEVIGDANNDAAFNIGDAIYLIQYIFMSGAPPVRPAAADVNNDCSINIGDAVHMINYIFNGGAAPVCSDCYD
ncbi:MAG: dockerin type I domain-containing protein [Candidatus Zixiibacteriota bacterium]